MIETMARAGLITLTDPTALAATWRGRSPVSTGAAECRGPATRAAWRVGTASSPGPCRRGNAADDGADLLMIATTGDRSITAGRAGRRARRC